MILFFTTKPAHSNRKFTTKTIDSHQVDIKNSDNTPHITLGTWGLGVDLMVGARCRAFTASPPHHDTPEKSWSKTEEKFYLLGKI